MLLFTRMVSLGYLFNICVSGAAQWCVNISFSVFFLIMATISCYLTIRLRSEHENKIQYYQHIAYAQGKGRSSIVLISLLLAIDYGVRISTYFNMATTVMLATTCRIAQSNCGFDWSESLWNHVQKIDMYVMPVILFVITLPIALYTTVGTLK